MPSFRHRLNRTQQRIYDRSNATVSIPLRTTPRLQQAVRALPDILLSADNTNRVRARVRGRKEEEFDGSSSNDEHEHDNAHAAAARVQRVSQVIADEIAAILRVPRVRIIVSGTRPSNARGELHGLYTPAAHGTATIKVWMITAKLGKVVAFKTFLRTLLHEICHHLDYALLRLADSLHTDGFYKRESSLFYQIGGADAAPVQPRETSGSKPANHG